MILQKVVFEHQNRNAISVDDFYYRGYEEKLGDRKGTGVRGLAAAFIKQGKIIDRFLILDQTGCRLEIYTFFKDENSFQEFVNHPIALAARDFWAGRNWTRTIEKIEVADYLNVSQRMRSN